MEQNTETDVRVKVFRDESGILKIECSRTLPSLKLVASYLSREQQRGIKKHLDWGRDVSGAISRSEIPFQDWANAIGQALVQADADAAGGSFEANALRDPAYLALGDTLFRLSPVELVKTNKALSAVKKRASEKASTEVRKRLLEGQLAADALVDVANRLKQQAEETLRNAARQKPAPSWAVESSIACKYVYERWQVECFINFGIEHFDMPFYTENGDSKSYRWEAVPQNRIRIRLWVPINQDGSYAISGIYVDHLSQQIPHISHGSGCLSPGDTPRYIKSAGDLLRLSESIERCMTGVQMDSLLVDPSGWLEKFKGSVPPELYKLLKQPRHKEKIEELAKSLDAAVPVPIEGDATWTA